jgi:hypothetical protein
MPTTPRSRRTPWPRCPGPPTRTRMSDDGRSFVAFNVFAVLHEGLLGDLHEGGDVVELAQAHGTATDHRGAQFGERDPDVVVQAAREGNVAVDALLEDEFLALPVACGVAGSRATFTPVLFQDLPADLTCGAGLSLKRAK